MKHFIIAAIVSLGLVAQSSDMSMNRHADNGQVVVATKAGFEGGLQQLNSQEMSATIGGENITGCWSYKDSNGDTHGICCVDLWIITVCVGVNWSEVERILDF